MATIRLDAVNYQVGTRYLVRDLSCIVNKGELVAIMGTNGAGKSTLMRLLSSEYKPSSGIIMMDNKPLSEHTLVELARKRGMLSQQNSVNLPFKVREIVAMGRYLYGRGGTAAADEIAIGEAMETCGVDHLEDRSMLTLSGGEQQRVHLARVLAQVWENEDALLLMDEPVASMDIYYQHRTVAILAALAKKGMTIITVLHELNLAMQYASRVILMKSGRKWWDGSASEVMQPQHIYSIFDIQSDAIVEPSTLRKHILPSQMRMNADDFNSLLPKNTKERLKR